MGEAGASPALSRNCKSTVKPVFEPGYPPLLVRNSTFAERWWYMKGAHRVQAALPHSE
jgi:hypothetical protein